MVDLDATFGEQFLQVPVDNPYRRYQRTANKITSGGKRNPTNPDGIDTGDRARRERFIEPASLSWQRSVNATEPFQERFGRSATGAWELDGFRASESRAKAAPVAGYDLSSSPVESVSALWAIAPREIAAEVAAAHDAAVADVIGWLEREAAFTRLGQAGLRTGALPVDEPGPRPSTPSSPLIHVTNGQLVSDSDTNWVALTLG